MAINDMQVEVHAFNMMVSGQRHVEGAEEFSRFHLNRCCVDHRKPVSTGNQTPTAQLDMLLTGKGKGCPIICKAGTEGRWRYNEPILVLGSRRGVGGQRHAPAA